MVDSKDRRARYKSHHTRRSGKLYPRWDGPYEILKASPDSSNYTLKLGPDDKSHPVFHAEKLNLYSPNLDDQFPHRKLRPPPAVIIDGSEEWVIDEIVDEKTERGVEKCLVHWEGYGIEERTWEPRSELKGTEGLEMWDLRERK